jgi:phage gp37-like protein
MNYTFKDYEDQLLGRLSPLQGAPLAELKGFAGEIILTESGLLLVLLNRFPAVLVEISGADYIPGPVPFWSQEVTATVQVCARSLRSQEEARGGEAGAYFILHEVRRLLLGQKLAENLLPLSLAAERKTATGLTEANEHIMIYEAKYKFTNSRLTQELGG